MRAEAQTSAPTTPEPMFPIVVNDRWRVMDDGALQWILQHRRQDKRAVAPSKRFGGDWYARSYCNTRRALLRCIKEYCGDVDPEAVARIETLPARHPQPYVARQLAKARR